MSDKKKVVIIGAGIGGAALSALLAQKGFAVTVLERNEFAGGKGASYERDGFICDMGVHYTGRGAKGPHGQVARAVNADLKFIEKDPFVKLMKGKRFVKLPLKFTGLVTLARLALLSGVKPWNFFGAYRAFSKLVSINNEKEAEKYDDIPLKDFVSKYTKDEEFHRLIDVFSGLLFVIPASEASAGEFMWSFSTWAKGASSAYPKGGFREIAISFLRAARREGANILYKKKVSLIKIDDEQVKGVEVDGEFYEADIVISNAGIKRTISMAGEENFSADYVKHAMSLKDSAGAVTIKYALDYQPSDMPIIMQYEGDASFSKNLEEMENGIAPVDPALFIPSPTLSDPDLAPEGKHLLLIGTIVPESLSSSDIAEKVLDNMEKKMLRLFPGIEKHIIWKHRTNLSYIDMMGGRGSGEVIGIAQSYDQVGRNKPDVRMPVSGLYLVGCDAGGRGIGTEQASDSALKVSELIVNKYI